MYALRQRYKGEHIVLMQSLVLLIMSSLYGVQLRRDIDDFYKCELQHRMETEYDEFVLDFWR